MYTKFQSDLRASKAASKEVIHAQARILFDIFGFDAANKANESLVKETLSIIDSIAYTTSQVNKVHRLIDVKMYLLQNMLYM